MSALNVSKSYLCDREVLCQSRVFLVDVAEPSPDIRDKVLSKHACLGGFF